MQWYWKYEKGFKYRSGILKMLLHINRYIIYEIYIR